MPTPEAAEAPPSPPAPPPATAQEWPDPALPLGAYDLTGLWYAVSRVEEKRGGSGRIEVPAELSHYGDRRRFLAVQMAATTEDSLAMPHDEAALAEMILRGELVELAPITEDYLLYQIGTAVDIDPLTHYDAESRKIVPLFATLEEVERERARLEPEARGRGREAAKTRERRELLASSYRNPALRAQLFHEHAAVSRLAQNFGGISYDLGNPADRARFVTRLLSFVRAPARDVLLPVARSYRLRFGRPLPVASLVRTVRYQHRLARVNSNASRVEMAPHTSGQAFDVSYKFMAPEEQNFLMGGFARLERLGLVEALREPNNSLHVYVFADGRPPQEQLVASFLDDVGEAPRAAPRRRSAPAAAGRLRGSARAQKRF